MGANLEISNLDGANLAGAHLAGAYLGGAYIGGANFEGANLVGAGNLHQLNMDHVKKYLRKVKIEEKWVKELELDVQKLEIEGVPDAMGDMVRTLLFAIVHDPLGRGRR